MNNDMNNKENNDMNDVTERLRYCALNYATALDAYLDTQPKQDSIDPDVLQDAVAEQLSEHDFSDQIQDAVDNHDFSDVAEEAANKVDMESKIEDYFFNNTAPTDEDKVAEIVEERLRDKLFEHPLAVLKSMEQYDAWVDSVECAAVNRYKSALEAEKEEAKEKESVSA